MKWLFGLLVGLPLGSCDVPRPRAASSDSPAEPDAGASVLAPSRVAPPPAAPSAPEQPGPFPPPPFELVAGVASKIGFTHLFCFAVRPGRAADYAFAVSGCGVDGVVEAPSRFALLLRIRDDVCEPAADRAAGLPVFGAIDLNRESDRVFGVEYPPREVDSINDHPGTRLPVAVVEDDSGLPAWIFATRVERETAIAVSSEIYRWTSARWRRVQSSPVGVEWAFARPFGKGILAVARERHPEIAHKADGWSMVAFGTKPAVVPVFAKRDDEPACAARVLKFETFSTGEVLAAGGTCKGELLLERWASGARDSQLGVVPEVDVGMLDPHPRTYPSWPPTDETVPLDIHGPSRVRARARDGRVFDVEFDESRGDWTARPSVEKLAIDRVRGAFAHTRVETSIDDVEQTPSGVTYASVHTQASRHFGDLLTMLLLRDRPMRQPCRVSVTSEEDEVPRGVPSHGRAQ